MTLRVPMPTDLEARVLRAVKDTGDVQNAIARGHGTRIYSQASQRCIRKGWQVDAAGKKKLTGEGDIALANYEARKRARTQ